MSDLIKVKIIIIFTNYLVLSTGLIMSVTHHKEIPKLMFGALPFVGASQGIVIGGFIYRKMELCYWLLHGNVKKQ